MSRAFGDLELKEPGLVISTPEIGTHTLQATDQFAVLACDGVWDVMSDQEVVDACAPLVATGALKAAAGAVVKEAYARGSTDNISVAVVAFDIKSP